MSKIHNAKCSIESEYYSTSNTVERFNMLLEIETLIKELRQVTISSINDPQPVLLNAERDLARLISLFSYHANISKVRCNEFITIGTTISALIEFGQLDSLDTLELVMDIENEFDVSISDEEAESFETVADILKFVS